MPELPEVETIVRSLRPLVVGRSITSVHARVPKTAASLRVLSVPIAEFINQVNGSQIQDVTRFGKTILIRLRWHNDAEHDEFLAVHLGMTGRLTCEETDRPADKHTHVVIGLNEPGRWIHYSDIRRFGRLRVTGSLPEDLRNLGPDPLELPVEDFYSLLHPRQTMIKSLLLDQNFLRGVGNIYADEGLFRAGIHPATAASRITRKRALTLIISIKETLKEAIALGGSSISDYVDAEGRKGSFQIQHLVYQRTGKPCARCNTLIRKMIVASRSTHFCPRCQKRMG